MDCSLEDRLQVAVERYFQIAVKKQIQVAARHIIVMFFALICQALVATFSHFDRDLLIHGGRGRYKLAIQSKKLRTFSGS